LLRVFLSVLGGLLAAFAVVLASDALFHAVVPSSSAVSGDPNDRAAMSAYLRAQPVSIVIGLVVGWAVAALVGVAVAVRFGARGAWPGWVVGTLFLVATCFNLVMVPHPLWLMALAIVSILAATWIGTRAGIRGRLSPGS
jgi:hypothetical protein